MLPAIGAGEAIEGAVTSDDVESGKPSPDLMSAAIARFQLDPGRTVAVGDTVWDVRAAARAELACVAVESGGIAAAALRDAGARQTFRDPVQLLGSFRESLLATLAPGGR